MKIRPLAHKSLKSFAVALLALLTLGVRSAAASSSIEEVWSFGGGAVAVQPLSNGTYQGTVVSPTTFATCLHPAGEVLWTDMSQQADGSFWGLHQWFHGSKCEYVTQLGLTAWRVLEAPGGAHFLRVCFSNPGNDLQPTIAVDGSHANTAYGCADSSLITSVPVASSGGGSDGSAASGPSAGGDPAGPITFANSVVLPPSVGCTRHKSLAIKLHDPKYDPFKEAVVKIGGKQVANVRGVKRLKSVIVIKNLPSGAYKVSVLVTTVLEQQLSGSSTYHSCTRGSGKIKLKRVKKTHHHR